MKSVLGEITKLRENEPMCIDYHNSNRYRLVIKENDGSKTAYYFSTPIYNYENRKLIDNNFYVNNGVFYLKGSNADIAISDKILIKNNEGACSIDLPQKCSLTSSQEINSGNMTIFPTTNGIALKYNIKNNEKVTLLTEVGYVSFNVIANDRCLSLMKEQFRPFVVFSSIGAFDGKGNAIAPVKIEYHKLTDKRFKIDVLSLSSMAQDILIEVNLYENKLFQDTTVESMNPTINNAFGSVAFIGDSSAYGEQWLYSKLDYSRISEIMDKQIKKAVIHIPKLNENQVELSAYKVLARFCSFGSNWNNKISGNIPISVSSLNNGYQSLDLTSLLVDERTVTMNKSEGLILKPKIKGKGFSAISTGDSCYAPQILEINYR